MFWVLHISIKNIDFDQKNWFEFLFCNLYTFWYYFWILNFEWANYSKKNFFFGFFFIFSIAMPFCCHVTYNQLLLVMMMNFCTVTTELNNWIIQFQRERGGTMLRFRSSSGERKVFWYFDTFSVHFSHKNSGGRWKPKMSWIVVAATRCEVEKVSTEHRENCDDRNLNFLVLW